MTGVNRKVWLMRIVIQILLIYPHHPQLKKRHWRNWPWDETEKGNKRLKGILRPTSRWWASWSENLFRYLFFLLNFVILFQPIKRASHSVVFFLVGYLLLWCQWNVFVTLSSKYTIHWGQLEYWNHFTNHLGNLTISNNICQIALQV